MGMWRKCQHLQEQMHSWASGCCFSWHDLQPLWCRYWEPECLLPKWRQKLNDLSLIHPRWLCLGKPPILLTLWPYCSQPLTTSEDFRGGTEGSAQNTESRWVRSHQREQYLYEPGGMPRRRLCFHYLPLRGCSTLLSSAMSQDWKSESLCPGTREVSEGLQFPLLKYMPSTCPLHVVLRKHPNFYMKAGDALTHNFFFK